MYLKQSKMSLVIIFRILWLLQCGCPTLPIPRLTLFGRPVYDDKIVDFKGGLSFIMTDRKELELVGRMP